MRLYASQEEAQIAFARRVKSARRRAYQKRYAVLPAVHGFFVAAVYQSLQSALKAADYWSHRCQQTRVILQYDDVFVVLPPDDRQRFWPWRQAHATILYNALDHR